MRGGRLGVVGGSIAGCAMALAAVRAGAQEAVVFERTAGRLADRGVGLGIAAERYGELAAAGFLGPGVPYLQVRRQRWVGAGDGGTADGFGRDIGVLPSSFRLHNWGSLWEGLRGRLPASVAYRSASPVVSVTDDEAGGGPVVELAGGHRERFDVVVGADGYRSAVRAMMFPGVRPVYAGYVLLRGTFPAGLLTGLLPRAADWDPADILFVGTPFGHGVAYRIPGGDGDLVNWGHYMRPPADIPGLDFEDPTSIPPGKASDELIAHLTGLLGAHAAPHWTQMLRLTPRERKLVQPIYDLEVPRVSAGRLLLAGDAASIARPHTGAGAVKAMQDATAFEAAVQASDTWDEALRRYEADRAPVGRAMVGLGRRLGEAMVLAVPDWPSMGPEDLTAWWQELTARQPYGGAPLNDRDKHPR
ncbi:FAD-dependent monooxygenase [Streptomyces sp. NPDC050704]|uniref:FAD-dependent monooxygenase n=1 Tax=Streptomyces sp. NPDC050704 TaxID=3157219 RepID=UPI003438DCB7